MDDLTDPQTAARLIRALNEGELDYLFQSGHVDYADSHGVVGTSRISGLAAETVEQFMSSVRSAQGLTVMAGAWGDYSGWITISAELVELLHEIDVRASWDYYSQTELPDDEVRAVRHEILIEEVLPLGLTRGELSPASEIEFSQAKAGARRMLAEGTEPASDYERWVLRFFELMSRLPELAEQPLTLNRLQELHSLLVLEPGSGGVFRTLDSAHEPGAELPLDGVGVRADRIPSEVIAIATYASRDQKPFVHPLVKAIILFYWIRRVQPFLVANGLFARLVAHIYEYQQGYRTLPFTPLTRGASALWAIPPRIDEGSRFDATSFVIKRLYLFLEAYVGAKFEMADAVQLHQALRTRFGSLGLNHRQQRILDDAFSAPTEIFTIRRHARTRGLAYETARRDFLQLVSAGYLEQSKRGRIFEFRLARDAEKKLAQAVGRI
jgi:Fic family protein